MRLMFACVALTAGFVSAQPGGEFAGTWNLNTARSQIRSLPAPPAPFLRIEQNPASMTVFATTEEGGRPIASTYPLDGSESRRQVDGATYSTMTKWEGNALLVNTLVSGPQNYSIAERWVRSRDGNTLTVKRTIVRAAGESESILIYSNPAAVVTSAPPPPERLALRRPDQPAIASAPASEYVVETGTRVLLRLTNSVDSKRAAPGDRIYLETVVPLFVEGRLVIPRGSNVTGVVTESKQAGRVKGKSALNLRFESITLPNGVTRSFLSRAGSVDTRGNLDRSEGRIEGDGHKAGDAATVGQTTAAGAGIGTIAGAASGHYGMGVGIGAAAGAAAGLAGILGSRGPQVVLQPGTTMELVLDRELRYTSDELRRIVQ